MGTQILRSDKINKSFQKYVSDGISGLSRMFVFPIWLAILVAIF